MIISLTANAVRDSKKRLETDYNLRFPEIEDYIHNILLEILLGKDFKDENVKKEKLENLVEGFFDNRQISIDIPDELSEKNNFLSIDTAIENLKGIVWKSTPRNRYVLTIFEAKNLLKDIFKDKIMSEIDTKKAAIHKVENDGIVFLDEIDKIASNNSSPNVGKSPSTDGVQRDLLPILEGTTVNTKYGDVKTDNILFIASGAFSSSKPNDLIPELLGRLPVKINLFPLSREDFYQILTRTKFNLIQQQIELLKVDGVELHFTDEAIRRIADLSFEANSTIENIGARRLHSVIEKVIEEISFECPCEEIKSLEITADYVNQKLKSYMEKIDLKRYLI